jgi:hypothetical protein
MKGQDALLAQLPAGDPDIKTGDRAFFAKWPGVGVCVPAYTRRDQRMRIAQIEVVRLSGEERERLETLIRKGEPGAALCRRGLRQFVRISSP